MLFRRTSIYITLLWLFVINACACFSFIPITTTNTYSTTTDSARANDRLSNKLTMKVDDTNNNEESRSNTKNGKQASTRRQILSCIMTTTSVIMTTSIQKANADIEGIATPSTADPNPSKIVSTPAATSTPTESVPDDGSGGTVLYTTKSGLKYIEVKEGTGPTPRYGNLCSISYRAYVKLPGKTSKLQEYDRDDKGYLVKHGNGRMIPGLDEGIHTLAKGGKRRLIIPPKLGYIGPGVLGPLPASPLGQYKLDKLLNQMIDMKGGNVVIDVTMRSFIEDEADQGYYDDSSISPDDFDTLRNNLQKKVRTAKAQGDSNAVDLFAGEGDGSGAGVSAAPML